MLIEIKCRYTYKVLYAGEHTSVKQAVERANLERANLARAYLAGVNLTGANLTGANLAGANLAGVKGDISNSYELLAAISVQFDSSLTAVAAMIAGRLIGCWANYAKAIREHFGEDIMRRLWQAWSQDESWGVVEEMRKYGWPEPEVKSKR